jgi:DNA-binding transcriptional ArsR family regulator
MENTNPTNRLTKKGEPMNQFVVSLSKEEAAKQGDKFLVLRNKTRLRIMEALAKYGGLLCVAEIAEVLEESPGLISNHLAMLRAANLVESEKFSACVYYKLKDGVLDQYKQFLEAFSSLIGE